MPLLRTGGADARHWRIRVSVWEPDSAPKPRLGAGGDAADRIGPSHLSPYHRRTVSHAECSTWNIGPTSCQRRHRTGPIGFESFDSMLALVFLVAATVLMLGLRTGSNRLRTTTSNASKPNQTRSTPSSLLATPFGLLELFGPVITGKWPSKLAARRRVLAGRASWQRHDCWTHGKRSMFHVEHFSLHFVHPQSSTPSI